MGTGHYFCLCGWRGDQEPEGWRCPQCGDLVGGGPTEGGLDDAEAPKPWQYEFVFSPWQQRQGLAAIIEGVLRYPIQSKRWKAREQALLEGLRVYAASHHLSPEREDWLKKAISMLSRDMLKVVLRMVPSIRFADPPQPSTPADDGAPQWIELRAGEFGRLVLPFPPGLRVDRRGDDLDEASREQWAHRLRQLMNREATEELIGPSGKPDALDMPRTVPAEQQAMIESVGSFALKLELDFARRSGRLNHDDERAIEALDAADANEREGAKALGWTEARFRKRMQRLRDKLAEKNFSGPVTKSPKPQLLG